LISKRVYSSKERQKQTLKQAPRPAKSPTLEVYIIFKINRNCYNRQLLMLVYEKYIKHKITEYNITKQAKSLDGDGQVLK